MGSSLYQDLSCLWKYFLDFILVILTFTSEDVKSESCQVYGNSAVQQLKISVQNCIIKLQKKEMKGNSEKAFIGFESEITVLSAVCRI